MEKGNKKIIRGWVFYDWANSVYNLVISSAIFPIFYSNVTEKKYLSNPDRLQYLSESLKEKGIDYDVANVGNELLEINNQGTDFKEQVLVDFFGFMIESQVLISFILSASFLCVAFLSPLLSGVADFTGNKKRFMQFFCYLGALSCISLSIFQTHVGLGLIAVFFASIGFWNSLVFYNSYLPEIAEAKDHDKISARGFSMGYFGSMLLLIICLYFTMASDVTNGLYLPQIESFWKPYYSFILVGLWWIGFSQLTYRVLPNNIYKVKKEKGYIWKGFQELRKVFTEFKKTKRLKRYLLAFFFFNTGVQTVMLMAVYFAKSEINWKEGAGDTGLIVSILLIQILGAAGAFLMSRLSGKIGNLNTLMITVSMWVLLCVCAYFISEPVEFYGLACGVGLVMGGVQAIARSTYSKFLPETQDHASYFSFYDATEKVGIVLGTFFYGLMFALTGDLKASILSITFFFAVGLVLLFVVPRKETHKTV
ncbi:MAG: MFS transporter [Lishizhenia sp.]